MDIFRMLLLLAFVVQSVGGQQGEKWTTKISYMIVDNAPCKDWCKGLIPYGGANERLWPFYEGCMRDTLLQTSENTCLLQTGINVTKTTERFSGCLGMPPWNQTATVSSFENTAGELTKSAIYVEEMLSLPVDCPASDAPQDTCTLSLKGEITFNPDCLEETNHDPCEKLLIDKREAVLKKSTRHSREQHDCKCTVTSKKPQAFDIHVLNLQSTENQFRDPSVNFVTIWDTSASEFVEEGIQLYPSMHRLESVRSLNIRFVMNGNSDALQILTIQAPSPFTLRCGEFKVPVKGPVESMAGVGMTIFLLIVLIAVTLFVFYWQRQDPPRPRYSEDFASPTSMVSLIDHGQPEPVVLYQNTSCLENTFQLEGSMPDLTIDRRRSQQMSRLSRTYSSPNLP